MDAPAPIPAYVPTSAQPTAVAATVVHAAWAAIGQHRSCTSPLLALTVPAAAWHSLSSAPTAATPDSMALLHHC